MKTQTNVPIEIEVSSKYDGDILEVASSDQTFKLPIFTKANGKKYVRFSSREEGTYSYILDNQPQTVEVGPYKGNNPLFLHGSPQISQEKTIVFGDQTPFFYLADTWWFGMTGRMNEREFVSLLKLRKSQGFSAIQIVVGIPPEVEAFDENSKNTAGFPFNSDWSLNKAYFDKIDTRIALIVESGLGPVIFAGWGHHIDWMGVEPVKVLWREIIARFASSPVIFSLAGEVDVFLVPQGVNPQQAEKVKKKTLKYLEKLPRPMFDVIRGGKRFASKLFYKRQEDKLLSKRLSKWAEVGRYIAEIDPFGRILTAHPNRQKTAFDLFGNPSWLTLNAIQSGHSIETLPFMQSAIQKSKKPIINLEPWYEGIAGNFDEYYQRVAFWVCVLSGAVGHGYGAHGIWQFSKNDNFMRHWGKSDSKEAITFAGASQLGLAREYLLVQNMISFKPMLSNIYPHVTAQKPFYPVCAKSNTKTCIYIPDQRLFAKITLDRSLVPKLITVIDPETMKKIKTMHIAGDTITMPIDEATRDILLVVE